MRDTRPQVLLHHIEMMKQHSSTTFRTYATNVRDVYQQRTPLQARAVDFHTTRDPYNDERLNAQIVKRALDDLDRLPCALEEALVLALPDPFRSECRRELAARYGELAAAIPATEHGAAMADAADLMRETGEALADLAHCFDDGNNLLPASREAAQRAMGNLRDVQACSTTLEARLKDALDVPRFPLRAAKGAP